MIFHLNRVYRQFAPSAPALVIAAGPTPMAYAIPAIATTSGALLIVNNSVAAAQFRFGGNASVTINSGQAGHTLPSQAATLFDELEAGANAATYIAVVGAGKLTIYRGSTLKLILYDDPGSSADPQDAFGQTGGSYPVQVPVYQGTE